MDTNKNKKRAIIKILGLVLIVASFLVVPAFFGNAQENANTNTNSAGESQDGTGDATFDRLNEELAAKRAAIDELKKKTELYEQNIKIKQQEQLTLQSQLSLIDLQIQQAEVDIERVKQEIEAVNLELEQLATAIELKTQEVDQSQESLAQYLRVLYKYDQKTYLEIFITNTSFSEFFDQLKYLEELEGNVKDSLIALKDAKKGLEQQQGEKEAKKTELGDLSERLTTSITTLGSQKVYRADLLVETKESEQKFEELLEAARQEEQAAEAEITGLETKAREKLEQGGIDLNTSAALMWPVNPTKGISVYFYDPTYIFRRYFEHPAIDIPVSQGTAVRAAENGYVVRAKNAGLGYSYIMIVHNNELSTVYGHMSRIDVTEESYVVRGQQIGLSGGMPGTPGAGRLTTGPHLHFEVRSNGIPVNPLDYLPAM